MDKQNLTSTLGQWLGEFDALAFTALRIAAIIFVSWLVLMIVGRLIRGVRTRVAARVNDPEFNKRAETLGRVFRYLSSVIVGLITVMLVLAELGVSLAPILGAAGVVGLAVGFGAQSLVKDFVTGFFLLLENQIRQGDVVQVDGHSGIGRRNHPAVRAAARLRGRGALRAQRPDHHRGQHDPWLWQCGVRNRCGLPGRHRRGDGR